MKRVTARLVLGIVAVAGWIFVAVGILAVFGAFSGRGGPNLSLILPAVVTLASGLVLVATSQVSFAVLDQADISRASLGVLRKLAEAQGVPISEVAPTPGQITTDMPPVSSGVQTRSDGSEVREYLGKQIIKRGNKHYVGDQDFISLGKAKAAIKAGQI